MKACCVNCDKFYSCTTRYHLPAGRRPPGSGCILYVPKDTEDEELTDGDLYNAIIEEDLNDD